ncbi:MAG: RimK family protein [Spirochaetes bacterium]|nr:RimK family protein [Spirochaetota bacterium]
MSNYIVVNNRKNWKFNIPGVDVISARDYLLEEEFIKKRGARVFNLCRSYRYQSTGYYVSLLASARGHRAFPDINAIQEMKAPHVIRVLAEDLDGAIQKNLAHIQSDTFILSIYFGKNISKKYDRLSLQIYNLFQAPLLRVFFSKKGDKWRIQNIQLISANDIPPEHHDYVIDFATQYFSRNISRVKRKVNAPYDMAILLNLEEKTPPSNKKAIEKFIRAGEKTGFNMEIIDKDDMHRLAEFDALFIRDTTSVNHYTFRFSQRAEAEGLVVIDDPESIIRCTNKVYLAELMNHYHLPSPKTMVISRDTLESVVKCMDLPLILKQPDSSYSQGVLKVESRDEYIEKVLTLLDKSDLVIAQEFMKTAYDWRVGIINGEPLFASRYYMAENHWQIINWEKKSKSHHREGRAETVGIADAPQKVIETAIRAAKYIGRGLYGVDLKMVNGKCYVIEVNDNPSIDSGYEDAVLKDGLYLKIMQVFHDRVRQYKEINGF